MPFGSSFLILVTLASLQINLPTCITNSASMHLATILSLVGLVTAQCPYGANTPSQKRESTDAQLSSTSFLNQFTLDDTNAYFTSDAGGPIQEDTSLKAGERGPTLLEDFIFRQKIQHFDHERVCLLVSPINDSSNWLIGTRTCRSC